MFDHLLESSHRDDSNKWSNKGFGQEIMELASNEVKCTRLIWSSDCSLLGKWGNFVACLVFKMCSVQFEHSRDI